jgi:hypothetical protein
MLIIKNRIIIFLFKKNHGTNRVLIHYNLIIVAEQCDLFAKFVATYLFAIALFFISYVMKRTYHEKL